MGPVRNGGEAPRRRILLVYQACRYPVMTYAYQDKALLARHFEVRECAYGGFGSLWSLFRGILWADAALFWFGKLHALFGVVLCRLVGRRAIVVAGGDDVANLIFEGMRFGTCSHPIKRAFVRLIFRHADLALAVSQYTLAETLANTGASRRKLRLVYNAVDPLRFRRIREIAKEGFVLTVGRLDRESRYQKGIAYVLQAARLMPDLRFLVVGPVLDEAGRKLVRAMPPNVRWTGWVDPENCVAIFNRASAYVQPSRHESFGCSVVEAMLCECVPVVSKDGALPEIVGDSGIYAEDYSPEAVAAAIRKALASPELGSRARSRALERFSPARREEGLRAEILGLLAKRSPGVGQDVEGAAEDSDMHPIRARGAI